MHLPQVSITIPCRNEEKYIGKCIHSILNAEYPKDKLKVFVCDGHSDDKSREIINEIALNNSNVFLLDNEKRTTPFALNLGLKASDAEVKIILGAHSEIDNQFFIENIKALFEDSQVGCAGGIIENVYEDTNSEIIGKAMSSSFGVGNAHFRTGAKDGYVDTVAFGAYKREVFEKIGYFDEDLDRNQDDEYNHRMIKSGFKIYLSKEIKSKYFVRGTFKKLYKQYYQYGYWKVYVNKKHKEITTLRQLVPFLFVLYLFGGIVVSLFSSILFTLYLIGLAIYFSISFLTALSIDKNISRITKLILVFFILHFSYGFGYLEGIFRFLVLGRKPDKAKSEMSR